MPSGDGDRDGSSVPVFSASVRGRILLGVFLDALFLAAWLAILYLFRFATHFIENSGDVEWAAGRTILGVSTLALIILYVYWDLRAVHLLLRQRYERAKAAIVANSPGRTAKDDRDDA